MIANQSYSIITLWYYYYSVGSLNSYDDLVRKYDESQAQLKSDSRKVLRTKPFTSQFFSVMHLSMQAPLPPSCISNNTCSVYYL